MMNLFKVEYVLYDYIEREFDLEESGYLFKDTLIYFLNSKEAEIYINNNLYLNEDIIKDKLININNDLILYNLNYNREDLYDNNIFVLQDNKYIVSIGSEDSIDKYMAIDDEVVKITYEEYLIKKILE